MNKDVIIDNRRGSSDVQVRAQFNRVGGGERDN
jgi:hypothetical protein